MIELALQQSMPKGGEPRRHRPLRGRKWAAASVLGAASAAASVAVLGAAPAGAAPGNRFTQTNLVSNRTDQGAQLPDRHLQNPWGLAASSTGPLWVAENHGTDVPGGANVATVYSGAVGGSNVSGPNLVVTIPGGRASTGDSSSPTGQVSNPSSSFVVTSPTDPTKSGAAAFILSSESGQISAWNPVADPIVGGKSTAQNEFSSPTAVYKGLAEANSALGPRLYATNFHDGTVDVFNTGFQKVTPAFGLFGFHDPAIPAGFAPFGIQPAPNGTPLLFVTYAKQDADKHDDVANPGNGFVDVYTTEGILVARFASHGTLNSPWGIAFAPQGFGPFSGDVLVGNQGDGRINVFNLAGRFVDQLRDKSNRPITIDRLWGLRFGNGTFGDASSLIFSAGINDEQDGLLGLLNPAS